MRPQVQGKVAATNKFEQTVKHRVSVASLISVSAGLISAGMFGDADVTSVDSSLEKQEQQKHY